MQAVTYSAFRKDLKAHMRSLRDDSDVILVTNKDPEDNVVVMSQGDYESLMETIRVYRNPYLYEKIMRGDEQIAAGNFSQHELLGGDADA